MMMHQCFGVKFVSGISILICCYTPIITNIACGGLTIVDVAILMVRSLTCSDVIDTRDTPISRATTVFLGKRRKRSSKTKPQPHLPLDVYKMKCAKIEFLKHPKDVGYFIILK